MSTAISIIVGLVGAVMIVVGYASLPRQRSPMQRMADEARKRKAATLR